MLSTMENEMTEPVRYISAESKTEDDFGEKFTMKEGEVIYDAATKTFGRWAMMTQQSFDIYGHGKLGVGFGQKYVRDSRGFLLKEDYERG